MNVNRRLQKELSDIQRAKMTAFRDLKVDERNMLQWNGIILPEKEPYNKGAFKIQIDIPAEYPFKPPKITFLTKIYHPNVDENGQVCLQIIAAANWKPVTKIDEVIQSLVDLIHDPEPEHPLRGDLAEEFTKDKKSFLKNASAFTSKHAEKRPKN